MGAATRRALVSGAAGFLGANLVRRLLGDGCRVLALVRPGTDLWRLEGLREDVELVEVDLLDRQRVRDRLARARPEWVFHLAAHGAHPNQRDVPRILATNLLGAANLLDASEETDAEAFVHAGSSSEYGLKDHAPAESESLEPNSPYAVGKAAATMYCQRAAREHDSHVVTLRLYSVYGPWEDPDRLIPSLVTRALEGNLPPLAAPELAHDFVFVGDVLDAFLLTAAAPALPRGSVYNVGTGRQTTLREAVDLVRRLFEIEGEPEWGSMPNRSWDTTIWVADPALIGRELGWRPATDLAAGLAATRDWLVELGTPR